MEEIAIDAPCCASVRECNVRRLIVIDPESEEIVQEVNAVRCHRGYRKTVRVSSRYVVLEYYVSNRGRVYLTLIHSPIPEREAMDLARRLLGLDEEIVIH